MLSSLARPSPVLFGSFSPINSARLFNAAAKSAPKLNLTSEKLYACGFSPRSLSAFSLSAKVCFFIVKSFSLTARFLAAASSAALAVSFAFSATSFAFSAFALSIAAFALASSAATREGTPFSKSCTFLVAACTPAFAFSISDCFVATSLARASRVAFFAFISALAISVSILAFVASTLAFWMFAGVASFAISAAAFSFSIACFASASACFKLISFCSIISLVSVTFFSASETCLSVTGLKDSDSVASLPTS